MKKLLIVLGLISNIVLAGQFDNKTIIIENQNTKLQNYDRAVENLAITVGGYK